MRGPTLNTASAAGVIGAALRRRVVIADDNRDAAEILGMLLELEEYEVTLANSGMEALSIGRQLHPDVFILDIGMPGMSGYDVCRALRREDWGRHVCSIALTGWGHASDKQLAAVAGFDHHVTKPCDAVEIVAMLNAHFQERAAAF